MLHPIISVCFKVAEICQRRSQKTDAEELLTWQCMFPSLFLGKSGKPQLLSSRTTAAHNRPQENKQKATTKTVVLGTQLPTTWVIYYPRNRKRKWQWAVKSSRLLFNARQFLIQPDDWKISLGDWWKLGQLRVSAAVHSALCLQISRESKGWA